MRSIKHRFIFLSLTIIVACTLAVGGLSLLSMARLQRTSTGQIIALTCLEESQNLNEALRSIKGSVDSCAGLIASDVPSPDLLGDRAWLDDFLRRSQRTVGTVARNTKGVCTYYLRCAPEVSHDFAGFFYTQQGREGRLSEQELTDITAFDESDTEHVGWYYQPKKLGVPMWMEPYYNRNIDVYMISYVVPIFVDGTFIGVLGMDVNFDVITTLVEHITPYETSCASLLSQEGVVYFSPEHKSGTAIGDEIPALVPVIKTLPSLRQGKTSRIHTYEYGGHERKLVCVKLINGMVLVLGVDTDELMRPIMRLLMTVVAIATLIALVSALVVVRQTGRIVGPLKQLVVVAEKVSEGNLDVELPEPGDDEVGILSRSLAVTVGSLKTYISGMSVKAYRDALTGVKNKAAYDDASERLQAMMDSGSRDFGIMMIDLNDLKSVNDVYGHDRGDDYLRQSCLAVCHVFTHSPVYRVGGDEFVVVLENDDLRDCEDLIAELDRLMEESASQPQAWQRLTLAKGVAMCSPDDVRVADVFRRADEAMYKDKRRMKAASREMA